jgi:hypothetical protein
LPYTPNPFRKHDGWEMVKSGDYVTLSNATIKRKGKFTVHITKVDYYVPYEEVASPVEPKPNKK